MRVSAFSGVCRAAIAVAMMASLPAFADIASFNAAVKARDYKAAAREAGNTWPTLDKSRTDIRLIAREFGYAAYLADDFAAARFYAQAAVEGGGDATPAEFDAMSIVLLRLAEFELAKSTVTRDALAQAIAERANYIGLDHISRLGAEALVAYDFETGKWTKAQSSTQAALKLMAAGGTAYAHPKRRMELYSALADYLTTEDPQIYDRVDALAESIIQAMDAASSDAEARRLLPLYWDAAAWRNTIEAHVYSSRKKIASIEARGKDPPVTERSPRVSELIHIRSDAKQCQREPNTRRLPSYPGSALYKGLVGSVIVRMDLDDDGRALNPVVLSSAPEKHFGEAVLKSLRGAKFAPGKTWNEGVCRLATKNYVVTYDFRIGGW